MSNSVAQLLNTLETDAKSAWREESELRERMHGELKRLERRRAFAFRRQHLVSVLAEATVKATEKPQPTEEARYAALAREVGWRLEGDFQKAIRRELAPVGELIEAAVMPKAQGEATDANAAGSAEAAAALLASLEAFETWYETAYGASFYALFDQEAAEVPLVDA